MEFPREIREYVEELAAGRGELLRAAERLSERYRGEKRGEPLLNGATDALAYAAARMPATFGAAARALELTLEHFDGDIGSVLDAGAGTGAASLAAYLLTGCADVTCVERERSMAELGEELCGRCGADFCWIRRDIADGFERGADMVISAYCLNEMTEAGRRSALERLWRAAGKLLVVIEPGTPEGFSQLKRARTLLTELGGNVAAPCPSGGDCPLAEGDWCHFTARIARGRLHKRLKGGDAPYEDEKFCFIAVSREPCSPCAARILRHPVTERGRITLKLCTARGVEELAVAGKDPRYKAARKASCGEAFDARGTERNGGITE